MSELLAQLQTALAGRYTIERELGRGGMATVYLAQDLKHHRPVALKVLHPQIAAVLGSERFLREIETAANLNHPHILPLFDSGAVGQQGSGEELLWYAMPLVEGESLRDRLDRETQLPLADALQIAREVADALGYAHTRGFIHRDIKPENIMLAHGHALVADFGIARAMGAAGGEKLTETGLTMGTASYMSPEQALGEPVDGRTDIYALGCVLYEMLAGEPPYTGPTPQAILARRLSMPVPSLGTIRDNLPASIERVIFTALARTPADRFATASAFVVALNNPSHSFSPTVETDSVRPVGPRAQSQRRLTTRTIWVGGIVCLLLVLTVAAVRWWPASTPPLDQGLVAIVPFRVAGNDPALAYLREGMMTMMVTKLNGDAGPRAVDDRTVIRLWDRHREDREDVPDSEVLQLAGEMGASRVIMGSVIGTPGRVVLSAQVLDVETGRTLQQATVEGLQERLPWLADQLAVELLALESGVDTRRLASLTSASVDAVKLYLDGRSAARRGRWTAAIESFNEALEIDSGFALAAMNLANASSWTDGSEVERGQALAWGARDRLSLRDRSLLEAQREGSLRAWENFVQKYPDIPEAWYALGDMYYHNGPLLGLTDAPERALAALRRGIALDPDTTGPPDAEPLMHLPGLALATGDTAGAVRLLSRLLANDSTGDYAYRLQLTLAQLSGDTGRVSRLRQSFAQAGWGNLFGIIFSSQQNLLEIPNAQPALEAVRHMGEAPQGVVQMLGRQLALNRGRPQAARETGYSPGRWGLRARISDALYWGGDTAVASVAAESLALIVTAAPPPVTDPELHAYYYDVCLLEQWRLGNDDRRTVLASIARLRAAANTPGIAFPEEHERCADLLDAWYAVAARRPDALQRLLRVDSLQVQEPLVGFTSSVITASNLIMARLWRMRGDWPRVEAAARRRYTGLMPTFLSTHLLEEGIAAAQAGHREAAIRAFRHYLALRYDPEPSVRPEVDQVRAELAGLLEEP